MLTWLATIGPWALFGRLQHAMHFKGGKLKV